MDDIKKIFITGTKTILNGSCFHITDNQDTTYLCYDKKLWDFLKVGNEVYIKWDTKEKKDKTGSYNRIISASIKPISEESSTVTEAQKLGLKVVEVKSKDSRDRSMCLSYAKDLVVGGKIEIKEMITLAKRFEKYLTEGE